jgi:hypothetical protein
VSQQSHPYWQASSLKKPLATVIINDFYLGVIIPPQTTEVEVEFRPFALWSGIAQVIYIVLGFGLLLGQLKVKGVAPLRKSVPLVERYTKPP